MLAQRTHTNDGRPHPLAGTSGPVAPVADHSTIVRGRSPWKENHGNARKAEYAQSFSSAENPAVRKTENREEQFRQWTRAPIRSAKHDDDWGGFFSNSLLWRRSVGQRKSLRSRSVLADPYRPNRKRNCPGNALAEFAFESTRQIVAGRFGNITAKGFGGAVFSKGSASP